MQFPSRSGAIKALAYRAVLISVLLALPVSIASATGLPPCTVKGTNGNDLFIVVPDTPDAPGEVAADAIICGGAGDDTLEDQPLSFVTFTGEFRGGKGNDFVNALDQFDGKFLGGAGDDRMASLEGQGLFHGGAGNDTLIFLFGGKFVGGEGNDGLTLLFSGLFHGHRGEDLVVDQQGGTYDGGRGIDTLDNLCGGTQISVEVIPGTC